MPKTRHAPLAQAGDLALYLELRTLWRGSPLLYVQQRFGVDPTWQQAEILEAMTPLGAKVTVRSGHGVGKSSSAAWIVSWFLETHDYAKVPCTAPSSHQLRDILWGELSKWRRAADDCSQQRGDPPRFWLSALFKLTTDSLYDLGAKDWGAFARTARKEAPESLQGFHGDHLLFVIDEGSGVPEEVFAAAEGALSGPENRLLMLGNPTRTSGTFHASHHKDRGSYTALHFRSQDSPLVAPDYRARLVRKWGEGSNVVRVRADGDFPRQEDDVLISLDMTEPCLSREPVPGQGPRILGVDPARMGSDRTVLLLRQGRVVDHIAIAAKLDLMQVVGRVLSLVEPWQVEVIAVDLVGLGAGVYDRLNELRRQRLLACQVHAVDVSTAAPVKRSEDEMQAWRLRDYLWLLTAQWLREAAPVFCAADRQACADLAGELASVKYSFNSHGALVVEDKAEMRKRLGHSPDIADSLICTFGPGVNALPAVDLTRGLDLRRSSFLPPDQRETMRRRFADNAPGNEASRLERLWGVSPSYDDEDYT
jgi:phage terminase large subunit